MNSQDNSHFENIPDDESQQQFLSHFKGSLQNYTDDCMITPDNEDISDQIIQSQDKASLLLLLDAQLQGRDSTDQELQQLNDIEKTILELAVKKHVIKRIEEKQKYVFKKAFKSIETMYFSRGCGQKKIRKQKPKNYNEFYTYYFRSVASRLQISIDNFIHPQKRIKIGNTVSKPGFKSFSQPYIRLILKSQQFKQDLKNYLQVKFLKDCEAERAKKLLKYIKYCNQIYLQSDSEFQTLYVKQTEDDYYRDFVKKKLEQAVLRNSKCKIPWTQNEILEAQQFALQMIQQQMDEE